MIGDSRADLKVRVCLVIKGIWKFCSFCSKSFVSCIPCSRRYKYCSEVCASQVKLILHRKANRKYQKNRFAKRHAAKRQAAYRARQCKEIVTDASSPLNVEHVEPKSQKMIVSKNRAASSSLSFRASRIPKGAYCFLCGCGPLLLQAVHSLQTLWDSS